MERVIPLFIHQLARGEPITVYGGDEKVLDFTYIDDCIDGIVRGVERLAAGRVANETINLAYGQGNTLVRAAELIAAELGVDARDRPQALARRRGHPLRRRHPQGARAARLAAARRRSTAGIPRAVEWFRELAGRRTPTRSASSSPSACPARSSTAFKPAAVSGA